MYRENRYIPVHFRYRYRNSACFGSPVILITEITENALPEHFCFASMGWWNWPGIWDSYVQSSMNFKLKVMMIFKNSFIFQNMLLMRLYLTWIRQFKLKWQKLVLQCSDWHEDESKMNLISFKPVFRQRQDQVESLCRMLTTYMNTVKSWQHESLLCCNWN